MEKNGLREVKVSHHDIDYRGYFHGWADVWEFAVGTPEPAWHRKAIIENEEGRLNYEFPLHIQFIS